MTDPAPVIKTILAHHPTVQVVYLFGSFGTQYQRPESDVDIALLLSPDEARVGRREVPQGMNDVVMNKKESIADSIVKEFQPGQDAH